MELKLGSHTVNLAAALPLTLGDMEALAKQGVNISKPDTIGPSEIVKMLTYVARKVAKEVNEDDVRGVTLPDLGRAMTFVATGAIGQPDRPS